MTDKVQKIREDVKKLKSQLLRGACSSQIAMETICKEEAYNEVLAILDSMQEKPVIEDLDKAAIKFSKGWAEWDYASACFKSGAEWQKEQFEKNRLAACDKQTEEEAEIESDFVMNIIKNEHRQPTFDDAIKYGMRLQKEQIRAKAEKVELSNASFAPLSSGNYKAGDKLIIIKEENL